MLSRNEIKYIQSLHYKKNRNAADVFIAEGVKIMSEILNSDLSVQKIYALKSWLQENSAVKNVMEINEDELKRISGFDAPNKVLAVVNKKKLSDVPDLHHKITLVLDGIQDPGNMGTIIRTADWFGVENIIASTDTAEIYNAKVLQASMGSFTRVNIFYTDLKAFLSANNIIVYAAMLDGEDVNQLEKMNECLLLIGNEGKGIHDELLPFIKQKITIPKTGKAESLNAAVATGILLAKLCSSG